MNPTYGKLRAFLFKKSAADWLKEIKRISRHNYQMFQRLVRIVWWDIASYAEASELKNAIEYDRFDPDAIPEPKVAEKLMELGYPEDFARKRSHVSLTGSHKKQTFR